MKYVVTWMDIKANEYSKEFDSERQAMRAKRWLKSNGALMVDLAVIK